jgi:hypothetical protein
LRQLSLVVCRTEQAVGATISASYKFKLLSRLFKRLDRAGAPLADELADGLAWALLVQHDVQREYSNLCFFYGTLLQATVAQGEQQVSMSKGWSEVSSGSVEELVAECHPCQTHSSTVRVHAPPLSGWAVIRASSNILAGGTGKIPFALL